ncbi:MAG: thioredoxin family protein [Calditrichia bacterium]
MVQKSIFRSLFGLVLLGFLATGFAQEKETVEPGWFTNMDKAMESAGKDGKLVLAYFSGSDWCKPCIMLKKKILTSDTFKKYASEKLVIVQLDFPQRKKPTAGRRKETQRSDGGKIQCRRRFPVGGFDR